ncbi:MAG TPA: HIT family protein [Pyrinomonadaceae bacterium]|jgi:histidine triad (HIT) family protein|nr:HIT family protein [Pyrinomonadaceae bacterium]
MVECVFCEIVRGRAEASVVFEDEHCIAFLSLDQPNSYKVLIASARHAEAIYDLYPDEAAAIMRAAIKLAIAIRDASSCEGLNLVQSNGSAGQQEVFHFHMHLLPRFEGDDIQLGWPERRVDRAELDRMAEEIRGKLLEH